MFAILPQSIRPPLINRHLVKPWLEELVESSIVNEVEEASRNQQYQKLLEQTDPNSDFERLALGEIYQHGYKLPDAAQELIPEANCKPDFLYKEDKIAIFCDGSVHDSSEKKSRIKLSVMISNTTPIIKS